MQPLWNMAVDWRTYDVRAQCQGKQTFASYTDATRILRARRERQICNHKRLPPMEVYRCNHCRHWHLGRPLGIHRAPE